MSTPDTSRRVRTGRRAGRKHTDVLEATARVIIERGADATRFADVSAATQVPVSSLQYYFGSREDMLVATFRHASGTELEALRTEVAGLDDPWAQIERILDVAVFGFDRELASPGLLWIESWRFALRDDELRDDVLADYAAWRLLLATATERGIERGVFTPNVSAKVLAIQLIALVDGISMPAALDDPEVSLEAGRDAVMTAAAELLHYDRATKSANSSKTKHRNRAHP